MNNINYKKENISKEVETMVTINNNLDTNIKDENVGAWIKVLEGDLEQFSLGESEDKNKEFEDKEYEDMTGIDEKIIKTTKDNTEDIIDRENDKNLHKKEDTVSNQLN